MRRRNEVLVGALLVSATIIAILGTLWLLRGGLHSGYPLYTRFEWGQNLKKGQPVALAGVQVGYVSDVQLRNAGYLAVKLSINKDYKIPRGSEATVQSVGIFGDVQIALTPPSKLPGTYYQPGDTVPPGPPAATVDQILSRVDSVGRSVQVITAALQSELVEAGGLTDIRKTIASTNRLALQLNAIAAQQNRNLNETFASLNGSLASLRHATSAVDSAQVAATVANLRQTSANTAALANELTATTQRLDSIVTALDRGRGTAGKLLTDTLLYSDTRSLVTRVDSLLTDFQKNPKKYINLRIF